MFFVFDRDCEKVDHQNRDPPTGENVDKGEWKSKQHNRLIEDTEKRVVKHNKSEYEKNHPRFLQAEPVHKCMIQLSRFHRITIACLAMISIRLIYPDLC